MDIPRIFNITESAHRIHNPSHHQKNSPPSVLRLRLERGTRVLDLGSGSGEMLCTWARDYGITGVGIDMSQLFSEEAKLRAGRTSKSQIESNSSTEMLSATSPRKGRRGGLYRCHMDRWGGRRNHRASGQKPLHRSVSSLIGEPYWRQLPPTEDVAKACHANAVIDFLILPELLASFGDLNYDVVEMVLADQEGWDRYEAAKWLTMRRWLEANPDDDFAKEVRTQLTLEPNVMPRIHVNTLMGRIRLDGAMTFTSK